MKCYRCEFEFPEDKAQCPGCSAWQLKALPNAEENSNYGNGDGTIRLSDVRSTTIERIQVGDLDYIFGGGIVPTSCNLIGGAPGAGKSTIFMQLLSRIVVARGLRDVLFIAAEQSDEVNTSRRRSCSIRCKASWAKTRRKPWPCARF